MEFIVAQIKRCVDRLEGLKIDVDLLFFAFIGDDGAAVDYQTVWRNWKRSVELNELSWRCGTFCVEFKAVLYRSDGSQDGESVDARLDVGSGPKFIR